MTTMTRRQLLKAGAAAGAVLGAPAILYAQSKEPIPIGALSPLTGAGGWVVPLPRRLAESVAGAGAHILRKGNEPLSFQWQREIGQCRAGHSPRQGGDGIRPLGRPVDNDGSSRCERSS